MLCAVFVLHLCVFCVCVSAAGVEAESWRNPDAKRVLHLLLIPSTQCIVCCPTERFAERFVEESSRLIPVVSGVSNVVMVKFLFVCLVGFYPCCVWLAENHIRASRMDAIFQSPAEFNP